MIFMEYLEYGTPLAGAPLHPHPHPH